jgi:hypothetical protein
LFGDKELSACYGTDDEERFFALNDLFGERGVG